jgi:hypothetical protein
MTLAQLSGYWLNVCSIAAARRRVFTQPRPSRDMPGSELLLRKIAHYRCSTRGNFLIDQLANQDHVGDQSRRRVGGQDAGHGQGSPSKQTRQMASAVSGSWHGLIA